MIKLNRSVYDAIVAHAQRGLPHEVCGYLAEKEGLVTAHYEMTNTDAAADHFSMKPTEQFQAARDMHDKGLKLKAVYHSHPETPARPSVEDIKLALDPAISYVIISLAATTPIIKSFFIKDGEVSVEAITLVDDSEDTEII